MDMAAVTMSNLREAAPSRNLSLPCKTCRGSLSPTTARIDEASRPQDVSGGLQERRLKDEVMKDGPCVIDLCGACM